MSVRPKSSIVADSGKWFWVMGTAFMLGPKMKLKIDARPNVYKALFMLESPSKLGSII